MSKGNVRTNASPGVEYFSRGSYCGVIFEFFPIQPGTTVAPGDWSSFRYKRERRANQQAH